MLASLPFPYTEKDAAWQIKSMLSAKKNLYYIFGIVYNKKKIGSIGIRRIEKTAPIIGEIGFFLSEAHWNKGIATGSTRWICAYVFEKTDITRIFAKTFPSNIASCRALEKTGFVLVETRKVNKNGNTMDLRIYEKNKQIHLFPVE